jgi:hypothetical protein
MNDDLFTDEPAPESKGGLFTDEPAPEIGQFPNAPYAGSNPVLAPEEMVRNEPGLQDVSVPDALAVQGAAGLGKLGAGLAARGVGALAEAIPATENLPETVGRIADNQMLKSTGASMGQIRQLGPEVARAAAKTGREAGLGDVFSSEIGREKALQNLDKVTGAKIGALREAAGAAPKEIPEQVAEAVKSKYAPGALHEGEAGGLERALNTVKEAPPTHAGYAKAATDLNKFAAGNKIYQPTTAATDVANKLSALNNAGIAQSLGADKAAEYLKALSDEQAYKVLKPFFERGELREMAGRGGVRGIVQQAIQSLANKGGYRVTSKFMDALHDALTEGPSMKEALGKLAGAGTRMLPAGMADYVNRITE